MSSRLLRNIWLKVSALMLAIVTWWSVQYSIKTTEAFEYHIRLVLLPNVVEKNISPKRFAVTVSGPNETVKAFRNVKHEYIIDLTKKREGKSLLRTIDRSRIELLPKLTIKSLSHKNINIDLDLLVQRELQVEVDSVGNPAPGFDVIEKFARPSRVFLELPQEASENVSTITTAPINITDLSFTVVDRVALIHPLDKTKRLPTFVDATIIIKPKIIERKYDDIPLLIMRPPDDSREVNIDNDKISVTLRGRADIMETFDKAGIVVYIDITKHKAGEYDLVPSAEAIEGIISIKPESVKYTINP